MEELKKGACVNGYTLYLISSMLNNEDTKLTGLAKKQIGNSQNRLDEAKERSDDSLYDTEKHIGDPRSELEHFEQEKERACSIVGRTGAVPTQKNRILNGLFLIIVLACIPLSLITEGILQQLILRTAIAAISVELIWIIHRQGPFIHFQLWMLPWIKWLINEMMRELRELNEKIDVKETASSEAVNHII